MRLVEVEKELKLKESKFLDLYLENSTQHDKILELTNTIEQEREAYANTLSHHAQSSLSSNGGPASGKKNKKQLKTAHSLSINPVSGLDDSDMILNYEKRLADMLMTIQK